MNYDSLNSSSILVSTSVKSMFDKKLVTIYQVINLLRYLVGKGMVFSEFGL
jgi:hypothetical protein